MEDSSSHQEWLVKLKRSISDAVERSVRTTFASSTTSWRVPRNVVPTDDFHAPAAATSSPISALVTPHVPPSVATPDSSSSSDIAIVVALPTTCSTVCLGGDTSAASVVSTPAAAHEVSVVAVDEPRPRDNAQAAVVHEIDFPSAPPTSCSMACLGGDIDAATLAYKPAVYAITPAVCVVPKEDNVLPAEASVSVLTTSVVHDVIDINMNSLADDSLALVIVPAKLELDDMDSFTAHEVFVPLFTLPDNSEDDNAEIRPQPWPSFVLHLHRTTSRLPWSSFKDVQLTPWPSWTFFVWVLTVMSKYNSRVSWTAGIIDESSEGNCAIQHCTLLSTGAAVLVIASSSPCFHVSLIQYGDDKFSGSQTVVEHIPVFYHCFRFLMNALAYDIPMVFIHAFGGTISQGTSVHQGEYVTCRVVWQWQDPVVTLIHLQPWPSWELSFIVQFMSRFAAHLCVPVNKYIAVNYSHTATKVQAKEAYYTECNSTWVAMLNANLV